MPKNKAIINNLDNLSFNKAFAQSRNQLGSGKVFTWRGNRYTTNTKSEDERAKVIQEQVVKASNEKTIIESPEQRKKVNSALDLQEKVVGTTDRVNDPIVSNRLDKQVKEAQDKNNTSIPQEISNYFKKSIDIGQNLINQAGELIDFDNDLINKTVEGGKNSYNKAKEILTEVSDDLHEVADDTVENAKIRSRNLKNKVNDLTQTVQKSAESELDNFKNKLNDSFLNKTLLPFIQKHVPWGDVDENTKKIIEDPNSNTEALTDNEKTNLFQLFTEKVVPKVTEIGNRIQDSVRKAHGIDTNPGDGGSVGPATQPKLHSFIPDDGKGSRREVLNEDVNPFIRDNMLGVLPLPIRQMLVQRANVTDDNMSDDEKLGLYLAYKEAVRRGDDMVKYQDYGSDRDLWKQFQGGEENLIDAGKHYMQASDIDKGAYNMMMTIGGEHFREEDGNIIFDQGYYDFNKREDTYDPEKDLSLYGKLRNFMGHHGVTETDPTKAKINISLNKQEMENQIREMEQAKSAQAHENAPYIYQNIPENIIPLLMRTGPVTMQRMRKGGVRKKYLPLKNK